MDIREVGNSESVVGCHEHLNFYFLGKSRSVSLADKQNLPYCEAFLWEVQRMSCVAAAGKVIIKKSCRGRFLWNRN